MNVRTAARAFALLLLLSCLWVPASHLRAQENGVYIALWPYDGAAGPFERSKLVFGSTPEEVCAQRSVFELTDFGTSPIQAGILFSGMLASGSCGYIYLSDVGVVVANPDFTPTFVKCSQAPNAPGFPPPPICTTCGGGFCPANGGKGGGGDSCTPGGPGGGGGGGGSFCGNPVRIGTGNKFQVETDLPAVGANGLSLVRYYNSGRPAYDRTLGGYWQHTYTRRIIVNAARNKVTYTRNDGKQLVFSLVSGVWTSDADVADRLLAIADSNGQQTWRLLVASTEDTESYDAGGRLISIQSRSGLTQRLTYADGTNGSVTGNGGFVLDAAGNPTTSILPTGLLLRVADHFGRTLTLGYDAFSRVVKLTDPAGGDYLYTYSTPTSQANLTSVTFPDGRQRQYLYNEPAQTGGANLPFALTGIVDENGVRFATYSYDNLGRATQTVHDAGGSNADRYQLRYDISGVQTTVIDPLGTARTDTFQSILDVYKNTGQTQPAASGTGPASSATSYDANGNVASYTDFNGNLTNYSYDLARNLETSRTEAFGTPQARTISTQWHPSFRLPVRVAEPLRITSYVYNGGGGASCGVAADGTLVPGVLCSKTIQPTSDATGASGFGATAAGAPRTFSYTYNANGSVLSVDRPRTDVSDVTLYAYYANDDPDLGKRGNVAAIANALGHTTRVLAYNAHGRPTTIVDPNGLATLLAYDARQRLTSRNVGGETTTYGYDAVGQLLRVTLPDGSFLAYGYDAAHRLTGIADSAGNSIAYTLDPMGNRIREDVFDPGGALAQTRSRVFDPLNRLAQEIGAQFQTTQYAYDNQGNVTGVTDPLGHLTSNAYDALNRLVRVTDPGNGVTQYGYNGIDQLVSVTDPRNLTTSYSYDGLANLNAQTSPDTGNTVNTYDTAGNLLTQTDAKGQTTSYTYDALNRVTSIRFAEGSKQDYGYDQGTYGLGRLTFFSETDAASQITIVHDYAYDAHGRPVVENRTMNGVNYAFGYTYDGAGRLAGLTYPSGRAVAYGFDAAGRISQVSTTAPPSAGGATQIVASNITYQPFGGVKSYTLGNGQTYSRAYDQDGRITAYGAGSQLFSLGYDPAGRIVSIADSANPASSNTYGYDSLDRLTSAQTSAALYGYSYDPVGNRTSKSVGSATDTYTYSATSNRIASITGTASRSFSFDANGSTLADGINQYAYDARGRMQSATSATGTTFYQVNALGQRVRKTNATDDRVFLYDLQGHLIAETSPTGAVRREYLYLNDIPLAVIQ
jgi:YD repeat-containing protein